MAKEIVLEPVGEDDLTEAFTAALEQWLAIARGDKAAPVVRSSFAASAKIQQRTVRRWLDHGSLTAAVSWPTARIWRALVDDHVLPVSDRLYRAAASTVDGTLLQTFLTGVRWRLTEVSTLLDDIKAAYRQHGEAALDIDWGGADGTSLPWRSRASLTGQNESQVTGMQAGVDSAPVGAMKRWVTRGDDKVRATHVKAGRSDPVPVGQPFRVGGHDLQYPGDPAGPASETMRCRCHAVLVPPAPTAPPRESRKAAMTVDHITAAVSADLKAPFAPRDTSWDSQAAKDALRTWATTDGTLDEDKLAQGYLWRSDGPPSDWSLPVATVRDGQLQLVWDGVTAAAAAAQGARTPLALPAADVDRIKAAISTLYKRAGQEFGDDSLEAPWDRQTAALGPGLDVVMAALRTAPGLELDLLAAAQARLEQDRRSELAQQERALIASALGDAIKAAPEWTPPAAWFLAPDGSQKELISPEGRVAGYVATWLDDQGNPTCHTGYASQGYCEPVPRGGDYSYFHQANVVLTLDDGTQVHPGLLTTDIGHGSPAAQSVDAQAAHYDNPLAIAAAVVVGEDEKGIWMAGSVLPDVLQDADRLRRLRLASVSGHWAPTMPGGPMDMIAVTAVNHPGFAQRSRGRYALAASLAAALQGDDQKYATALLDVLEQALVLSSNYLESGAGAASGMAELAAEVLENVGEAVATLQEWTSGASPEGDAPPEDMAASGRTLRAQAKAQIRVLATLLDQLTDPQEQLAPVIPLQAGGDGCGCSGAAPEGAPASEPVAASGGALAALPDGLEPELVAAARAALAELADAKALKAASVPDQVTLPKCLQILSDYLSETGADSPQQSRAAAVKAAESICRSGEVIDAALRAKACRLLSEYRVKSGGKAA